jgi:hypothetical protein
MDDNPENLVVTQCAECGTGIDVSEADLNSGRQLLCMCCAWGIDDEAK